MKNKGFTFIELLVVMTIIGVLMAVGVTSFSVANKKGRDGKRKSDLEQIRAALELYRVDVGVYPPSLSACGDANWCLSSPIELGGVTYMDPVPTDSQTGERYFYYYRAASVTYALCTKLELTPASDSCGIAGARCAGVGGDCDYGVDNPL